MSLLQITFSFASDGPCTFESAHPTPQEALVQNWAALEVSVDDLAGMNDTSYVNHTCGDLLEHTVHNTVRHTVQYRRENDSKASRGRRVMINPGTMGNLI